MLQKISEHIQGWIAGVIIAVIALMFVLWGLEYYISQGGNHQSVAATVNGAKITAQQVNNAYQILQRNYAQQGAVLNEQAQQQLQNIALQEIILNTALMQIADKMGLRVGMQETQQAVFSIPAFQTNGQFSQERFRQILVSNNISPEAFLQNLQASLLIQQLSLGIQNSAFVLPNEILQAYQLAEQQRSFGYFILPSANFVANAHPTPEEMSNYYEQHKDQYQTPERVKVAYVTLSPGQSDQSEQLSDLVYTHPSSLEAAAQALHLTIQTSPWISRQGVKGNALFEDPKILSAVFSNDVLTQGNNSAPIELKNGELIVVRVAEHQAAQPQPFSAVQDQIKQQLQKDLGQKQAGLTAFQIQRALETNPDINAIAHQFHLTWNAKTNLTRKDKTVSPEILMAAFNLTPDLTAGKKNVTSILLPNGDYAIIQLQSWSNPASAQPSAEESKVLRSGLTARWGQWDYQFFAKSAVDHAKIEKK